MWRHRGVTAGKRSDGFGVFLLVRSAAKKPAKKLPPMSLDKNTLKITASTSRLAAISSLRH
jgi:hypothetical protein